MKYSHDSFECKVIAISTSIHLPINNFSETLRLQSLPSAAPELPLRFFEVLCSIPRLSPSMNFIPPHLLNALSPHLQPLRHCDWQNHTSCPASICERKFSLLVIVVNWKARSWFLLLKIPVEDTQVGEKMNVSGGKVVLQEPEDQSFGCRRSTSPDETSGSIHSPTQRHFNSRLCPWLPTKL